MRCLLMALVPGMLFALSPVAANADDLTSANYMHRAGTIVSSSAVGAQALQSAAAVPTLMSMDATVGAAPTAAAVGSSATLRSLLPGYLAIVIGSFPTLDLDGDLAQFFLDLDDDGDGLEDEYETGTGFFVSETNTGTSPVLMDSDGDGFDDGQEVLAGSDPNSPASTPSSPQVPAMAMPLRWLMLAMMLVLATMSLRAVGQRDVRPVRIKMNGRR